MPYDIPTPKSVKLSLNKVVIGDWVVVTLPYRKDASFNVQYADSQASSSSQMLSGTLSQIMQYPRQYYYRDQTPLSQAHTPQDTVKSMLS